MERLGSDGSRPSWPMLVPANSLVKKGVYCSHWIGLYHEARVWRKR
jgi:hypothetical protein